MFKAKKNKRKNFPELAENAKPRDYSSDDITTQLYKDFHGKCYICGKKTETDHEVEHFEPHLKRHDNLKYDWNNLFWSCKYCNSRKSNTYNNPEHTPTKKKEIINVINQNPEKKISHLWKSEKGKYKIEFIEKEVSKKVKNSIELLEKIFNKQHGTKSVDIKQKKLRKKLYRELGRFQELIFDIINFNDEGEYEFKLKVARFYDHIRNESEFVEFKREYLRQNLGFVESLEEVIFDIKSLTQYKRIRSFL